MNQARFIDIHVSYRTGGISPEKCAASCDAVIIQAGVGNWFNPLLQEQMQLCREINKPYATYHIPDPADGPMADQVDAWYALPGVAQAVMIADIEKPTPNDDRCVNAGQVRQYMERIAGVSSYPVLAYSRVELLERLFGGKFPSWWNYRLWLAQYLYESGSLKHRRYETFLARWAGRLPPAVQYSAMFTQQYRDLVVAWQISDSGDARFYIANEHTGDPVYKHGIMECDLNVSTIDRSEFIALLTDGSVTPPPPRPLHIKTRGKINIRSAPLIDPSTDVGDLVANNLEVIEDVGLFWRVAGYVAKSVTEVT